MMKPPDEIIELAVKTARLSPCAKSKRGVVIYSPPEDPSDPHDVTAIANGFNGQPKPFTCDASERCRETCAKRCAHAEERAIRQACIVEALGTFDANRDRSIRDLTLVLGNLREYEAVHVKVDAVGNLTWGGGPSCWQCSRTVLDVNLGAFWLYERENQQWECPYTDIGKRGAKILMDMCPYCTREACTRHPELQRAQDAYHRWYPSIPPVPTKSEMESAIARACHCTTAERHAGLTPITALWRRYTAEEFHRATLVVCGILD